MHHTIGLVFITLGIIFMIFGCIALYKFKNFYSRILTASLIDTAGFIMIMIGSSFYSFNTYFTLKVLLVVGIVMILNPVGTHFVTKSAYYSGYHLKRED